MHNIRRYGLLALALLSPLLWQWLSADAAGYFHVICIIVAVLSGKSYIGEQDVRGWGLANLALIAHAGCLVIHGILWS